MAINYNKGFKLSYQNYKVLRNSADLSAMSGNFGLACSLNILSCEELIKAYMLFIQHLNPNIAFKNFKEVFRKHGFKHQELREHITATSKYVMTLEFNILHEKEEFLNRLPQEKLAEYLKEYKDMERVKKRCDKIKQTDVLLEEVLDWLQNANTEKNLGLYVDLAADGSWKSPNHFIKSKFKIERAYANLLRLHIKNSIDITAFMKSLKERNLRPDFDHHN